MATYWDIGPRGFKVDGSEVITDEGFLAGANEWAPAKNANNPIITGTALALTNQFYPPGPFRSPAGTYYIIGKSGGDLYGFESADGITGWSNATRVLENGAAGTWDADKLEYTVVRYDPATTTYHLYYIGEPDGALGHATASSPLGPWTKDAANPILTPAQVQTALGGSISGLIIGDVVKHGSEYIFYMVAVLTSGRHRMFVATGSTWTNPTARNWIFRVEDTPVEETSMASPSVIRRGGTWLMVYTAGQAAVVADERRLYAAVGGPYHFTPLEGVVLPVGASGTWEDRRVYAAQFLKEQDGEYLEPLIVNNSVRLYYSGHSVDATNQGVTGLAEFTSFPLLQGLPHALPKADVKHESVATDALKKLDNDFVSIAEAGHLGFTNDVSAWPSTWRTIEWGNAAVAGQEASTGLWVTSNAWWDGTSWRFKSVDEAAAVQLFDGVVRVRVSNATAVADDDPITWVTALEITNDGSPVIGQNKFLFGVNGAGNGNVQLIGTSANAGIDRVFVGGAGAELHIKTQDISTGAGQKVTAGAADSAGAGFRLLRIPN